MNGPKRPRRPGISNSPVDIVRGIKTLKTIYWTTSRLLKLVPGVFSTSREEHFGKSDWASLPSDGRTTAE